MVSFSFSLPAVNSRKLTFPDHWTSSSRRKLVSPVSLGILLSFIAVSAVFVNVSSKGPFLNPLFQRLNIFGYHSNSSSLYWPFSAVYTESCNTTVSGCNVTAIVQTAQNLVSETHEQNVTDGARSSEIVSSDNKRVPEKLQNGSFVEKIDKEDVPEYVESSILNNSSGKREEPDNAHSGDFTEDVKNSDGSTMENGSTDNSSPPFESNNTSSGAEFQSRLDGNISNYSYVGDDGSEGARAPAAISASLNVCDIFNGRWVRDETKPYYPPGSCPYIDRDFDCHINGRADNEYEKWRWQPYNCDVPRLNATDFLERLRGQKLVFVGDSLNRNMWESLVCLLRHEVEDKNRVYEISGRHEFKKKGFYAFRFEDYNCSVDFVSSPFLVKESSFNRKNGSIETLRLDLMDGTTHMYHDADVIIFNTGHWWTHEKTSRGEDYYQEGNHVHTRLKVLEAYKRALITWARWVDRNVDTNKTQVIFRGFSVTHFRGGPWNSGGQCQKETEPIFNETFLSKYPSKMKVLDHVLNDMKNPVIYLNISRLTDYRKDGHPSIYRPDYPAAQHEVHAQDCSHWCLPGVPDTWNELLYASLLKSGRGSWSWRQ